MILRYLIEKELKQFMRTRILPILFVIIPIALMNFLPRAANQEARDLTYCVVDNDHSLLSQRLIEKMSASPYFTLTAAPSSYEGALREIEEGRAQFIVEIPAGFDEDIVKGVPARVMVSSNAVNGMKAGLGQSYLLEIVNAYARELTAEQRDTAVEGRIVPIPRYLFNTQLDYKVFMIPGVIAFLLILLIGFLPALNIVLEKESGTIEQLNVSPISRFDFILAKLVPYWFLGLYLVGFSILLARGIYGLVPAGPIGSLFLFATLFILVVSSLGLLVSNYSETARQAALLMLFFLVVFILTSGLITPIASMPEWAQAITCFNPLRYFIDAFRAIYLRGSDITDLLPQAGALALFFVVAGIWAVGSYRKSQ